ncbi:hypothetical protein D5086_012704 [Populus alba]|uniref:Uncharacterized protein n=1 Tax=Populus alba TaxID=43335 RepID=A0ACC4C485_POPAL
MLLKFLFLVGLAPLLVVQCLDSTFNDDVLGLIVFKAGLQDPESKLSSWNEDDDSPCSWVGVKCEPNTHRVTELFLDGFSLSGHIGRGLLRLQFLQVLSLANNKFNGTINPDLPRLGGLQVIDLSDNSLSGSIPDGFFQQCGSLRSVSFARNDLTGMIPGSLSSCLTLSLVNFSSNGLCGELPSGLWYLRGLQSLDLSDNLLEGEIPEGIANLYDLRVINLKNNRFTGQLPVDIGGSRVLKLLDFSENSLSGSLPESLQRLNSCATVRLGGNSFTGEVPGWIGELTDLENLDLSANRFSGRIPVSIGNLNVLKELNLSMNQLTGGLPESMMNCLNLLAIDVSHNRLTGNLPSWIFKSGLNSVSPSGNRFNESIQNPSGVSLAVSIQGDLPLGGFFNTISPSSVSGNPSLCGSVVNLSCPSDHQKPIVLNPNSSDSSNGTSLNHHHKIVLSISALTAIGAAACITLGVVAVIFLNIHAQSSMARSPAAFAFSGGEDFSFLEVVTGKRPVEYMEDDVVVLCDMVRGALEDGRVEECIDSRLGGKVPADEAIPVIKLGLICASQVPSNRPDMEEVVNILELIQCPAEGHEELE